MGVRFTQVALTRVLKAGNLEFQPQRDAGLQASVFVGRLETKRRFEYQFFCRLLDT